MEQKAVRKLIPKINISSLLGKNIIKILLKYYNNGFIDTLEPEKNELY